MTARATSVVLSLLPSLAATSVVIRAQEATWPLLHPCSLELAAHWDRLTDTTYHFDEKPIVRDLAPAQPKATYTDAHFRPFLPPAEAAVGSTWRIEPTAVLPFLRQLHSGASIALHHDRGSGVGAHGTWGCLRAIDSASAEIVLRAHAEFRIAGDGADERSSWFTPAMFRGRLSIDRKTGKVAAFELAVPKSRANVDVNLWEEEGHSTADIGSVPRLQLVGGSFPLLPATTTQISEHEADRILERRFYPFATLDWLDLPAARAASLATGKPLHVVVLFGSLSDESC